jgi:hypothetical protein
VSTESGPSPAVLQELLDRAVLRNLSESYAGYADARESAKLADLFVPDGRMIVALNPGQDATAVRTGREEIAAAIDALKRYWSTTHMIGNVLLEITGDTATGQVNCTAHHIEGEEGSRRDRVLYIRYLDEYARHRGGWRFRQREVRVLAVENRPLAID